MEVRERKDGSSEPAAPSWWRAEGQHSCQHATWAHGYAGCTAPQCSIPHLAAILSEQPVAWLAARALSSFPGGARGTVLRAEA